MATFGLSVSVETTGQKRIHAYDVYMQKLQILFPEPQLKRLRQIAREQDRPVSEIVRESVNLLLNRYSDQLRTGKSPPSFSAGQVKVNSDQLRRIAYSESKE